MLYDGLEDGYTDTSLGRIHFKHGGKTDKKVIFLPGIGADTRTWKRLVAVLPDTVEIYLVDLLGHGGSDAPKIEYTVKVQAQAVKEFIERQGASGAYLFGHSYGGWIAALIAQEDYGIKGIILEDAAGLKDYFDDVNRTGRAAELKESLIRESLLINPREWVIRSTVESEVPEDYLTNESLGRIRKPALVIWGGDDRTLDVKYADIISTYIPESKLEIIPGAGHVPHYTNAAEVAGLIAKFVG